MSVQTVESVLAVKGRAVTTTWSWATISEVSSLLAGPPSIGALVVLDERRQVAGLLTEGDVVRGVQQYGAQVGDRTVGDLMHHATPTCAPGDELPGVLRTMTTWRLRQVPVVEHGELVGLVSLGDIVQTLLRGAELEVAVMRDVLIARS